MPKKLSERIAEGVAKRPSLPGKNRAIFLSLREDIAEALAAGWSRKVIWKQLRLEEKIDFSYVTFCTYVKETIDNGQRLQPADHEQLQPENEQPKEPSTDGPVILKPAEKKRFIHSSQPNKEDLL